MSGGDHMATNGFKKPYNPATGQVWGKEREYGAGNDSDRYQWNPFRAREDPMQRFTAKQMAQTKEARRQAWEQRRPASSAEFADYADEQKVRNRARSAAPRRRGRGEGSSVEEKLALRQELQRTLREMKKLQLQQHSHHHHIKKLRIAQQNLPYNYNVATVGKVHKHVSQIEYLIKQLDRELLELGYRDPSMETSSMYSRSTVQSFNTGDIDWSKLYSKKVHKSPWQPAATLSQSKQHVFKKAHYEGYPAR